MATATGHGNPCPASGKLPAADRRAATAVPALAIAADSSAVAEPGGTVLALPPACYTARPAMTELPPLDDASAVALFRSWRRWRCDERALVLVAMHIKCEVRRDAAGYRLVVALCDTEPARRQLHAWELENHRPPTATPASRAALYRGLPAAVVFYAVLMGVNALARNHAFAVDWQAAGTSYAFLVRHGEWWRTVTALTLHADAAHLAGNLLFGSLFGLLLSQSLGPGLAWFSIVLAGALGNAANAWLRDAAHASIGASTAVFGAIGLLAAHTFMQHRAGASTGLRRALPLMTAVALFAFLGTAGEHTDVLAHLAGLTSGVILGLGLAPLSASLIRRWVAQWLLGAAALSTVMLAWGLALRAGA